jgi:hypothetical protein
MLSSAELALARDINSLDLCCCIRVIESPAPRSAAAAAAAAAASSDEMSDADSSDGDDSPSVSQVRGGRCVHALVGGRLRQRGTHLSHPPCRAERVCAPTPAAQLRHRLT